MNTLIIKCENLKVLGNTIFTERLNGKKSRGVTSVQRCAEKVITGLVEISQGTKLEDYED